MERSATRPRKNLNASQLSALSRARSNTKWKPLTHEADSESDGLEAASALEDGHAGAGGGALNGESSGQTGRSSADNSDVDVVDRSSRCCRRCHDSGAAAAVPPSRGK